MTDRLGLPSVHVDTRCRGTCGSQDPSRPAYQSPAVFDGTRDAKGRLVPACPCCGLRLVPSDQRARDMEGGLARTRFGGEVIPEGGTLWLDNECLYDVVTIKRLKAT